LVLRFTHQRRLALLAATVFASLQPVQLWLGMQRPDLLALALSLVALVVVLEESIPGALSIAIAALNAQAAMWTRQTSCSVVLVVVAWYVVRRQPVRAAIFALVSATLALCVVLRMNATSDGGFVWQQFVLPSQVDRSASQLATVLRVVAAAPSTWLVAIIGLAWAAVTVRQWWSKLRPGMLRTGAYDATPARDAERSFTGFAAWYLAAAIVMAAGMSTRGGSNTNYWLETCAVSALMVPLALKALAPRRHLPGATLALLAAFALSSVTTAYPQAYVEKAHWEGVPYLREIVARLRQIAPDAGPVLTAFPELAEYAGRAYYFNDGIQYDRRSPEHNAIFLETLRAGTFPAVVLPFDTAPRGYTRSELEGSRPPYPVFFFLRR
jgi:hypothetical protein